MATLHFVNSPAGLERCLSRSSAGDVIVAMHDGCYAPLPDGGHRLSEHAAARGLAPSEHDIGYDKLVELTVEHQPVVTWR